MMETDKNKFDYFVFLLEAYAGSKNQSAKDVLNELDRLGLTEFIMDMYDRYHTESIDNAFEDIDRLIEERKSIYSKLWGGGSISFILFILS